MTAQENFVGQTGDIISATLRTKGCMEKENQYSQTISMEKQYTKANSLITNSTERVNYNFQAVILMMDCSVLVHFMAMVYTHIWEERSYTKDNLLKMFHMERVSCQLLRYSLKATLMVACFKRKEKRSIKTGISILEPLRNLRCMDMDAIDTQMGLRWVIVLIT